MRKIDELRDTIAREFSGEYKAYDLEGICKIYGIEPDSNLDPMNSKRLYMLSGLNKLDDDKIWNIARKIVKDFQKSATIKDMEPYLSDTAMTFSFATRQRIIELLDSLNNMEGKMDLDDFLNYIWDMSESTDFLAEMTKGEEIVAAVKINKTMSYKKLLTDCLEIKYLPDEEFIKFLECLVKPEVREEGEQIQYVQKINEIIKEDGYELYISSQRFGTSYYNVDKKRSVEGELKNLIFASKNEKPDITIENSITNELRLIGNTDNCLFYNFKAGEDGVQWNTLIEWWKENNRENQNDPEKELYGRLRESLDSDCEKIFFRTYYNHYRHPIKKDIPALIPQVYLHYDPRSKWQRQRNGDSVVYTHQRMDFLMLLPGGVQIIFEVDGHQHYSQDGKAKPALYAEMVRDDRELRLKRYEVYRFGGYELMDEKKARPMLYEFFDKLFEHYEVVL